MATILIVDDAQDASEPLARFLEKAGHRVRCARDGRDALVEVIARQPDVVLLDLFMPNMDGPTFLNLIRSYLRLQSLPVVVHTGFPDHALSLKVNAVLTKADATFEDIKAALEAAVITKPAVNDFN